MIPSPGKFPKFDPSRVGLKIAWKIPQIPKYPLHCGWGGWGLVPGPLEVSAWMYFCSCSFPSLIPGVEDGGRGLQLLFLPWVPSAGMSVSRCVLGWDPPGLWTPEKDKTWGRCLPYPQVSRGRALAWLPSPPSGSQHQKFPRVH